MGSIADPSFHPNASAGTDKIASWSNHHHDKEDIEMQRILVLFSLQEVFAPARPGCRDMSLVVVHGAE